VAFAFAIGWFVWLSCASDFVNFAASGNFVHLICWATALVGSAHPQVPHTNKLYYFDPLSFQLIKIKINIIRNTSNGPVFWAKNNRIIGGKYLRGGKVAFF